MVVQGDTAAAYHNEIAVGKAIQDLSVRREDLILSDKVWNKEAKQTKDTIIAGKKKSNDKGHKLTRINNPYEWLDLIKDANYTILLESNVVHWQESSLAGKIFEQFHIPADSLQNIIRVYNGPTSLFESNEVLQEDHTGTFIGHSDHTQAYKINSEARGKIIIDDTRSDIGGRGLKLVVYDNNYREVLDSVVLYQDTDGKVKIKRS